MSKKCPECGYSLKFWNVRAECPKCKTNIPNYNWEARLDEDADTAELAYAKLHYRIKNFKSAVCGTRLRIARLVLTFAPLIALVLPLYSFNIALPFLSEERSVSFLTFILDYLLKTDIGSVIKLMGGEVLGTATVTVVAACLLLLFAVACGVLNFFVLLLSGIKMQYMFNVVLNALAALSFGGAAILLMQFTKICAELGGGIITGGSTGFGFIVGVILFSVNFAMNLLVGKGLKKQLREQPSMEEFVQAELESLRNQPEPANA